MNNARNLVAFLQERIGEDEALALTATQGCWEAREANGAYVGIYVTAHGTYDNHTLRVSPLAHTPPDWRTALRDARHMAAHDPVRVGAECQGRRDVLEIHRASAAGTCVTCSGGMFAKVPFPCTAVRSVVASYTRHPDFDPTWLA